MPVAVAVQRDQEAVRLDVENLDRNEPWDAASPAGNLEDPGVVDLGTESFDGDSEESALHALRPPTAHAVDARSPTWRAQARRPPSCACGSARRSGGARLRSCRWLASWTATGRSADNRGVPRVGGPLCAGIAVLGGTATLAATLLAIADASVAGGLWWVLAGVLPLYAAAVFAFWRRPQHAAVRCLLVAASLLALSTFFEYLLRSGQVAGTTTLWLLDAAYLLTETGASLAGVGFFALFPVGRPERRYERVIVRTAVTMALLVPALVLVARPELTVNPFSFSDFPPVANPTFVPAMAPIGGLVLAAYVGFWMVALPLAALMLALRYRRSGFAERRQIRWLLLGVSVGALGTVPWVLGLDALGAVIGVPCMLATVGCIVVALLDAGLLDVDAIIRKSLVYGILWLLIALGFVAAASVLGVAASRELPLAVAITLAITAAWAFQPARRRLERLAERWVFGERLSHYEVVTRFGDALEEVGDLDGLLPKLADTVRLGLGVRFARVRLDPPPGLPHAQMPQAQSGTGAEPELVIGLVHHGIQVGAIECGPKRQGPFTAADTRLLATLAQQAAAVAYGLRLRTEQAEHLAEISRHSAELSRSRARLVEVQDAERRRLQTQVHDGVQQSVAAVSVRLGLARNQLRRGDERVAVDARRPPGRYRSAARSVAGPGALDPAVGAERPWPARGRGGPSRTAAGAGGHPGKSDAAGSEVPARDRGRCLVRHRRGSDQRSQARPGGPGGGRPRPPRRSPRGGDPRRRPGLRSQRDDRIRTGDAARPDGGAGRSADHRERTRRRCPVTDEAAIARATDGNGRCALSSPTTAT